MALTKHGIRANGLSFLRDQTVERERGEEKREEEKKRRSQDQAKRYGTTNLEYGTWIFGMDPWFCLVNGLPQT